MPGHTGHHPGYTGQILCQGEALLCMPGIIGLSPVIPAKFSVYGLSE
jgi:hypothetical protein